MECAKLPINFKSIYDANEHIRQQYNHLRRDYIDLAVENEQLNTDRGEQLSRNGNQSSVGTNSGKRNRGQAGPGQGADQRRQNAECALLARTKQMRMVLKQGEPDVSIISEQGELDKEGELDVNMIPEHNEQG